MNASTDGTWEPHGGETVFAPAAIWESGYAEGVQDSMLRATQVERVLTDLIAELRDQVAYYPGDVFPPFTSDDPAIASRTPDRIAGVASRHAWTRAAEMADRAEARLREVGGDE